MPDAPLLYEVTVAVDADAADAYRAWLADHVPEVVDAGGFLGGTVYEVADAPDDPGSRPGQARRLHLVAHYAVPDRAALDAYLAGPAAALRADAEQRFGGRFTASRRVLVRT